MEVHNKVGAIGRFGDSSAASEQAGKSRWAQSHLTTRLPQLLWCGFGLLVLEVDPGERTDGVEGRPTVRSEALPRLMTIMHASTSPRPRELRRQFPGYLNECRLAGCSEVDDVSDEVGRVDFGIVDPRD
jgi:hypothetical protein